MSVDRALLAPVAPPPLMERARGSGAGVDVGVEIEVRRSARRRKTVSAYREGGRIVVLLPARCTAEQEREWVQKMVTRLSVPRSRRPRGDEDLLARAIGLARQHLDRAGDHGAAPLPTSVAWSSAQGRRWGSCTVETGAIRVSTRLQAMPDWVIDYVLVHELAHLQVPDHSARFWHLVGRYPKTERARGFLEGLGYADAYPAGGGEPVDAG